MSDFLSTLLPNLVRYTEPIVIGAIGAVGVAAVSLAWGWITWAELVRGLSSWIATTGSSTEIDATELGASGGVKGVVTRTERHKTEPGHFREGLQLSPGTARLLADWITGRESYCNPTDFDLAADRSTHHKAFWS